MINIHLVSIGSMYQIIILQYNILLYILLVLRTIQAYNNYISSNRDCISNGNSCHIFFFLKSKTQYINLHQSNVVFKRNLFNIFFAHFKNDYENDYETFAPFDDLV